MNIYEEMTQKEKEARQYAMAYNDAMNDKNFDAMQKAEADLDEAISEYNKLAQTYVFEQCRNSEDPMIEAVTRLTYTILRPKVEEVDDEVSVMTVKEADKAIDLGKLHKYCKGIGKNTDWYYMAEKFNMLLTAQKCKDLNIDPKTVNDSFEMSRIAKEYNLGLNPASKTKLLDALRMTVQAMIGEEYKPVSHDINYLLTIYAKKNNRKALTVTCANHKFLRQYVGEICHRLVTGKHYECEYKKVKA